MQRIIARRPVAVTLGRYDDYKAVVKRESQTREPATAASATKTLSSLFEEVGASPDVAQVLAADVAEVSRSRSFHAQENVGFRLVFPNRAVWGDPDDDIPSDRSL